MPNGEEKTEEVKMCPIPVNGQREPCMREKCGAWVEIAMMKDGKPVKKQGVCAVVASCMIALMQRPHPMAGQIQLPHGFMGRG